MRSLVIAALAFTAIAAGTPAYAWKDGVQPCTTTSKQVCSKPFPCNDPKQANQLPPAYCKPVCHTEQVKHCGGLN